MMCKAVLNERPVEGMHKIILLDVHLFKNCY